MHLMALVTKWRDLRKNCNCLLESRSLRKANLSGLSGSQKKEMLTQASLFRVSLLFVLMMLTIPALSQEDDDIIRAQWHYNLGRKFYRSGQTEQAIEELYAALSAREIFFDAQLLLGKSLIETKRYREAAATLKEIEPRGQITAEVQKLLGKVHYEMNKLSEAAQNLNYAIILSRRPDYELHYLLSLVRFRQGEVESAIGEAKRAAALNSRFRPAYKLLSDAYLMQGDCKQAEKVLKRYLSGVRDPLEAEEIREQIEAMKSLERARPEKSVQKPISLPRIYRIPRPEYTPEALRNKVEGVIKVEVLFGSDGTIQQALVVRGLGFGLDEEALKAAKEIKFKPGEVDGKPVSMWIGVQLTFSLPSNNRPSREGERIALTMENLNPAADALPLRPRILSQ